MDVADGGGVAADEEGVAVGAAVQDLVGAVVAAEEVVDSVVADVARAEWAEEASPETLDPPAVSAAVLVELELAELVL